jgi:lipoate-protein ligase B
MTGILYDLGRREYGEVLSLQRELVSRRARGEIPDSLILVEHEHVITLGRKTSQLNFRPQDIPVFQVERGGDATYHGPGQLVGYPIVALEDHDVRRYVRLLEEALISAVGRFGVQSGTIQGHPGVWVKGRKLASIGVAVTNWVAFHGFALNVNTDLSYFSLIRPCGLDPGTMTSMKALLGQEVDFKAVKLAVLEELSNRLSQSFVPGQPPLFAPPGKD